MNLLLRLITFCRLQKVQSDLLSLQGEVASGLILDFTVPTDLIGVIIGKKVRISKPFFFILVSFSLGSET